MWNSQSNPSIRDLKYESVNVRDVKKGNRKLIFSLFFSALTQQIRESENQSIQKRFIKQDIEYPVAIMMSGTSTFP